MDHNFEEMTTHTYPIIIGEKYWHCKQCDSVVRYPSSYSQAQINRLMANKLLCVERNIN